MTVSAVVVTAGFDASGRGRIGFVSASVNMRKHSIEDD